MDAVMLGSVLAFGNLVLSSINVIVGFSLFAYVLTHNFRSPVARAFCALMAFVTIVHLVDVGVSDASTPVAANLWLRFQWVGIAFVPAAYYHFSDAVLRATGSLSRWRRFGVIGTYVLGCISFAAAISTDLLVDGITRKGSIYHLVAGPWFWLFALYYALTSLAGWWNIRRARSRSLTSTSRRRMSYLMWAFVAPGIGAFPFLLVPTTAQHFSANVISFIALLAGAGVAIMNVVIGYSVAYQGVFLPDRVVKHSLIHFLLRGPVVGSLVIVLMLVIPKVERILGLSRDTVLIVAVAGSVVILQLLINLAKPALDRLIYRKDRQEIAWIQTLDQRLLTTTDLEQLLENTLIALCDLLRVPSGFVVTMRNSKLSVQVFCGPKEAASAFLSRVSLVELMETLSKSRQDETISNADFVLSDGHWLLPLRSQDKSTLGILGIAALGPKAEFSAQDLKAAQGLVHRAELALEDMQLQQQVFAVLQRLEPELDRLQEWRSIPRYAGLSVMQGLETNPLNSPSFVQMVKDALSQFWGGPKLSQSPLLGLRITRNKLAEYGVPAKALRAVLQEAIERLRPAGERSMTANEWMIYNILDLKFVQGLRIRDAARRLAMSESDFYRKQRIAIEQVAATLAAMERASED